MTNSSTYRTWQVGHVLLPASRDRGQLRRPREGTAVYIPKASHRATNDLYIVACTTVQVQQYARYTLPSPSYILVVKSTQAPGKYQSV